MKKLALMATSVLLTCSAMAQSYDRILMVVSPTQQEMTEASSSADDDERAAYQWFMNHTGATYADAASVGNGTVDLTKYTTVWVVLDRQIGPSNPNDFVNSLRNANDPLLNSNTIAALTNYYKHGGNLLLTNHASVLLKELGRYRDYPFSLNGFKSANGENNGDVFYARVSYMNMDDVNDKSKDPLFANIDITVHDNYRRFPLNDAPFKEDHNSFFNLDVTNNDNHSTEKYAKLASEFGVEYLAVWPHITDICSGAITRWNPFNDYKGKAIAIGFGGYEWHPNQGTNNHHNNIITLTANALAELSNGTVTEEPDVPVDPVDPEEPKEDPIEAKWNFAGAAMLGSLNAVDDDEAAARAWFEANGGKYIDASEAIDLTGYKVVWVNLDRQNGTTKPADFVNALANDPLFSTAVKDALKKFYQDGGHLLLTNHASVMLKELGRYRDYPNSLDKFSAGEATNVDKPARARLSYLNLEEINDKSKDPLYNGIEILTDGYRYFNLIGAGLQEQHFSFFTLDVPDDNGNNFPNNNTEKYARLRSAYGVEQLAVVDWINDICSSAITRWLPMDDYNGAAIAIGFGGYEWNQNGTNNPHRDNIERLTANALNELLTKTDYDHIYSPEPPKPVEDGLKLVHYDMDKQDDGTVADRVSGANFQVRGRFSEAMPGAVDDGTALRLDAFSSYVEGAVMNDAILNRMTVDLWCAAETYPMGSIDQAAEGWGGIAGTELDGRGWLWEVSSRGNYRFFVTVDNERIEVNANEKFEKYQWNHLVASVDAQEGRVTIYNNGREVGSTACRKGTITLGNGTMIIGKSRNSAEHVGCLVNAFNGLIDDITVYSGIDNVASLNSQKAANEANLIVSSERYAGNILRPQFHAAAGANWGNETHGLYFDKNTATYHAFYQKNANGQYLSHMHWGHLVSKDLLTWNEVRTAIAPSEDYDWKGCWSGCVFQHPDYNNGQVTIFYTGVNDADPCIVESLPQDSDLLTWDKRHTGISRPTSGYDFRDPYVFEHNNEFYMIIGCANGDKGAVRLHTYDKGSKKWNTENSVFFEATGAGTYHQGRFWEMPTICQIDGEWVMTVTTCNVENNDVRALYWVGTLEGTGSSLKFKPYDNAPRTIDMEGLSGQGYGFLSPSIMQLDGKTIAMCIVPDKLQAAENCANGWSHNYSLPRQWNIVNRTLVQQPIDLSPIHSSDNLTEMTATDITAGDIALPAGRMFVADIEFDSSVAATYGIRFFKGNGSDAELTYDVKNRTVKLNTKDLNRIGFDSNAFAEGFTSTVPAKPTEQVRAASTDGQTSRMQVVVDHSTVEVFIDGAFASSMRIYPKNTADTETEFFIEEGDKSGLRSVKAYALTPGITQGNQHGTVGISEINSEPMFDADFTDGTLTVTAQDATVSVTNLAGMVIATFVVDGTDTIPMNLAPGMYLVTAETAFASSTRKVIVR